MRAQSVLFFSVALCPVLCAVQQPALCATVEEQNEALMVPYTGPSEWSEPSQGFAAKVFTGYQGWFTCAGDGSGKDWVHYGHRQFADGSAAGIEVWPDMSELEDDEQYPTPYKYADGTTASLFSSFNAKTVNRHFAWMKDYGIDVAVLQRFLTDLQNPQGVFIRNKVLDNVRRGANRNGVGWCLMYDLSGMGPNTIEKDLLEDWKALCDRMKIREDKAYHRVDGKPLVCIWGVGFSDGRQYSLEEIERIVRFLKDDPVYGGNTVLIGVPSFWRARHRDAVDDPKFDEIIGLADIISPWSVGRYTDTAHLRQFAAKVWAPDLIEAKKSGKKYLPVIFPGFSWVNLQRMYGNPPAVPHQIPRLKGNFLWQQAVRAKAAGAEAVYVAMFDELDEATAVFKITNDPPVATEKVSFLTLEEGLPSDYYLRVVRQIGGLLRGDVPPDSKLPDPSTPAHSAEEETPP